MRCNALPRCRIALAILAATGSILLTAPSVAQRMTNEGVVPDGPVSEMARMNEPRDEFHLYSGHDVELVRFKSSHLLSICVARADRSSLDSVKHAYPLAVSFDGSSATIEPGNCLSFEAASVRVKPATSIPQNVELSGTVRVIR